MNFADPRGLNSQYSIGASVTVFAYVGVSVSYNSGFSTNNTISGTQLFGTLQGNVMVGRGTYFGASLIGGYGRTRGSLDRGFSSQSYVHTEFNAGEGIVGGATLDVTTESYLPGIPVETFISGAGRFGLDEGAMGGVGKGESVTLAYPTFGEMYEAGRKLYESTTNTLRDILGFDDNASGGAGSGGGGGYSSAGYNGDSGGGVSGPGGGNPNPNPPGPPPPC